jgi:hypothetical protein
MVLQEVQQARAVVDLNCRELLFLLACIETSDGLTPALPENRALYQRLVQEYVGIVRDGIDEPCETRHRVR